MTSHEEHFRRHSSLAHINQGPGTKKLENLKPGDRVKFSGGKVPTFDDYYLGIDASPKEIRRLDEHTWVLWFPHRFGYPRWAERVLYDSYSRAGLSDLWEKQLSPSATAEEKAEHADAGTIAATLKTPGDQWMWGGMLAFTGAVLALPGWFINDTGLGAFMVFCGAGLLFYGAMFGFMAECTRDRNSFWRALDKINELDLRRPPRHL